MKKSTNRKLTLRAETVAKLSNRQLGHVAGGSLGTGSYGDGKDSVQGHYCPPEPHATTTEP